ncbi:MAG: helix-turn-helix domain-containing protein [Gemmatimonadaceae bacterium]
MEDSPERLREPLRQTLTANFRLEVIAKLALPLSAAPPRLALALTQEFVGQNCCIAPKQLAAVAGMDRRSVERWFRRIGLVQPKTVLAAAHFVTAFPVMKDPWVPLHAVAREYGFSSVRTMSRQCQLVFGLSPQSVRRSTCPEDLPRLIYTRLCIGAH